MDYTPIAMVVILVIAICEAVKTAGVNSRWIPLLSVILAIAGAYFFDGASFLSTVAGVIVGLSTTGGYRLIKTTLLNK